MLIKWRQTMSTLEEPSLALLMANKDNKSNYTAMKKVNKGDVVVSSNSGRTIKAII